MKRILLSSVVAAVTFAVCFAWACFTTGQASAQVGMSPAAQGPGGIALVDVNYIFKKHARLKDSLEGLKADSDKVQKEFEGKARDLQAQAEQLKTLRPGTPDYARLEESLMTQKAGIQAQIAIKRKEFVQKEAHLYFNAYREITDEVTYYSQQHGIALVLNFNGDAIHDDNPDDVARGISNKVVFYNRNLDITPVILSRFVKNSAPPVNPGPAAFVPQPQR